MSSVSAISSHDDALNFLFGRINYERSRRGVPYQSNDFKLDRMHHLLDLLGNPQHGLPVVHIAGTKGKGSTAAMASSILTSAGYRTGLHTSPHLEHVEERIQIDGVDCPPEQFVALMQQIAPAVHTLDAQFDQLASPRLGPTYFEILTAAALRHFVRERVDLAVVEVGLGGRLDSTNVCEPVVSMITSISLDHTRQLGNTLPSIAREKAGIIKQGVPVVTGVTAAEPLAEIKRIAAERQSPLLRAGVDFEAVNFQWRVEDNRETIGTAQDLSDPLPVPSFDYRETRHEDVTQLAQLPLRILGRHQADNAAVAIAALRQLDKQGWHISERAVREGLAAVNCPGRIEFFPGRPAFVLDAAHNRASVQALLETLDDCFPNTRRVLIFATSKDKDAAGMLAALLPKFSDVILTRFETNPRARKPEQLRDICDTIRTQDEMSGSSITLAENAASAIRTAQSLAGAADLICMVGSFFLVAESRAIVADQVGRNGNNNCRC